jgi:hypothetical protein
MTAPKKQRTRPKRIAPHFQQDENCSPRGEWKKGCALQPRQVPWEAISLFASRASPSRRCATVEKGFQIETAARVRQNPRPPQRTGSPSTPSPDRTHPKGGFFYALSTPSNASRRVSDLWYRYRFRPLLRQHLRLLQDIVDGHLFQVGRIAVTALFFPKEKIGKRKIAQPMSQPDCPTRPTGYPPRSPGTLPE